MVTFFLTTCENIVFMLVLVAFFRRNKKISLADTFLFTLIYSSVTTFTYYYITDLNIRMIFNIIFHFFCIKYFFSFSIKNASLITLIRSAFQMLFELVCFLLITFFFRYFSIELPFIGFALLIYTLIALLTVIFYKKHMNFGLLNNKNNYFRNMSPIFIIALLQIITACLTYFEKSKVTTLPILTIILMVSMLLFIFKVIKKEQKIVMRNTEQLYLTNLEQLLHSIRGQRHDHMNHIHVISHLISTEGYKEASSYLKELSTDIDMSYSLLVLDQPSLIALLQTKSEYARINGVELEIIIKNPLTNIPLKSYELVQVMGNIIDNAFEEEINSKKEDKKVTITIDSLYNTTIVISVNNINSLIDQSLKKNILAEGYSLKENHQGIGLYTVMNILKKYNGFLEFESDKKSGTTFFIFLPK